MNTLALLCLASLIVGIASGGTHYKTKPVYNHRHPATWILAAIGIASIALSIVEVAT